MYRPDRRHITKKWYFRLTTTALGDVARQMNFNRFHFLSLCIRLVILSGLACGLGCSPKSGWKRATCNASGEVRCGAMSHGGAIIAIGTKEGVIELWDITTNKRIQKWDAHAGPVYSLAFDKADKRLASEGRDGKLILWDTSTGSSLLQINDPSGARKSPEPPANNSRICFVDDDQRLAAFAPFWDTETGQQLERHGSRGAVACTDELFASHARSGFHVMKVVDATEVASHRDDGVQCLAISPDNQYLAVGRAAFDAGCVLINHSPPK